MKLASQDNAYALLAAGSAFLAARAARTILSKSWRAIKKKDPPENPAALDASWQDAFVWSIVTGMAIGVVRMLAKRGAAAGWDRIVGHRPPGDYNNDRGD